MAFWDREKDLKQSENKLPLWEEARMLSSEVAAHPDILTLGWYFYKENYLWHGLKPNDTGDGFQKGYDFQTLRDLQQWLGIPVPQDLLTQEEKKESLTEQLAKFRQKPISPPMPKESAPEIAAPTYIRKRDIDIHIKASSQENDELMKRVKKSGMTKTNYLLRCALQSEVQAAPSEENNLNDMRSLLDLLSALLAEVGRQGGLLKMIIKPNEGQRPLHPEEWDALIHSLQDQARVKKKIEKMLGDINGYFKTHNI